MRTRLLLAFVLVALPVLAGPAILAAPPAQTLYVRCGRLIVDAEQPPLRNAALVITDGKVTAVGVSVQAPAGAQTLDLSAYTVAPALVDVHTHLWTGARGQMASDPLAALRATKAIAYALESGVAAMRVVGSFGFVDVALREAVEEGTIPGPHIVPGAHAISIPGGHGDFFPFPAGFPIGNQYTPMNGFVNSPADAEQAVHYQIKYGARVIKMLASGGVGSPLDSPTAEQLSPEEMRVVVEQAHMSHLRVAAHAENLKTTLDALHAGVDSIEHGSDLNQEAVAYMKDHGVYLVPTLHVVDSIVRSGERRRMPEFMLRKGKALAEKHFPSFKLALAGGVTMAAGSDMSYEPGEATVIDEVVADVAYGMTPQQALAAGTRRGAALLGLEGLGSLATGMEGSLIAMDGDPLADIHALERIKVVVHQGRVVIDRSPKTKPSTSDK